MVGMFIIERKKNNQAKALVTIKNKVGPRPSSWTTFGIAISSSSYDLFFDFLKQQKNSGSRPISEQIENSFPSSSLGWFWFMCVINLL